jgi:hypothetical protein
MSMDDISPQWKPIEEMPKDGFPRLVCRIENGEYRTYPVSVSAGKATNTYFNCSTMKFVDISDYTHYQELPETIIVGENGELYEDDSYDDKCFHECESCHSRCNCSSEKCVCCEESKCE